MQGRFGALASVLLAFLFCFPSWAGGDSIFAPRPITRPHQRSIELPMEWHEFLRFEVNRGPSAVDYQEEVLKALDPDFIQSQMGFRSFSETQLNISSFEIRSLEVIEAIERLVAKGVHLRLVMDAAYIRPLEMPSDEVWESWGPRQRLYFINAFDRDQDGLVTERDIGIVNHERSLAIHAWNRFQEMKHYRKDQIDLITPPYEMVPESEKLNYPRIHHMKLLSFQFRKTGGGAWEDPSYAWITSSNFTETGLRRRISNISEYIDGQDPVYDPQSEGQIQFGASFRASSDESRKAIQALSSQLDLWVGAYREGKSFDQVRPPERQHPRIVFKDGSSLQAFFSEGVQRDGQETLDPVWVISKILSRKDIQLSTYYDAQFVFTHTGIARLLRSALNFHKPERFGLMVDSSQALEPWSALPALIYAPFRRESYGVYPGKGIESYDPLAPELQWQDNILVYRGGDILRDKNNDKLHLKARYFEFIDSLGVTNHVVLWGSANSSHNASKLSADAYYLFQSTDPKVGEELRPFFEALMREPRMQKYSTAFLERYFFENFYESVELRSPAYLKKWAHFLSKKSQRRSFEALIGVLKRAGASTGSGQMILRFLEWHLKYNGKLAEFNWEDLELIIHLSQDERHFSADFLEEVSANWTLSARAGTSLKGARQALKNIFRSITAPIPGLEIANPTDPLAVARASVYANCRDFLSIVKGQKNFERMRYPLVESKRRRRTPKP